VCEHVPVSTELVASFQDRLSLPKVQFEVENYSQIQVESNEEFCQKENQGIFFSSRKFKCLISVFSK